MVKPLPKQDVFFRLYYDDNGEVITYSMENLDGKFIEITSDEFALGSREVYVKDGVIHNKILTVSGKLVPSNKGVGTHPEDITLVDNNSKTKWKYKEYE